MSALCKSCEVLGIENGSDASWIVHTSVDDAKTRVKAASRHDLVEALAHMFLSQDSRVSLKNQVAARLNQLRKTEGRLA